MNNTQIFDVFNESLFNASVSEFEDEDGKYEIRLYNGHFLCTIGISTKIDGEIDDKAIEALNRSQFPFKYSRYDNSLRCSTAIWIDRKPTKKGLSEIVSVATCSLKSARELVIHFNEEDDHGRQ